MRYVLARYEEYQKELAYRIYVSDSLFYLGQLKSCGIRYYDVLYPPKEDTRTADEIVLDTINKLELRLKTDECI